MPKFQRIRASSFHLPYSKVKNSSNIAADEKNLEVKNADVAVGLLHKAFRSHYFQQVKSIK